MTTGVLVVDASFIWLSFENKCPNRLARFHPRSIIDSIFNEREIATDGVLWVWSLSRLAHKHAGNRCWCWRGISSSREYNRFHASTRGALVDLPFLLFPHLAAVSVFWGRSILSGGHSLSNRSCILYIFGSFHILKGRRWKSVARELCWRAPVSASLCVASRTSVVVVIFPGRYSVSVIFLGRLVDVFLEQNTVTSQRLKRVHHKQTTSFYFLSVVNTTLIVNQRSFVRRRHNLNSPFNFQKGF